MHACNTLGDYQLHGSISFLLTRTCCGVKYMQLDAYRSKTQMSRIDNEYIKSAAIYQLLAHPYRLQILDELRRGDACVCHLQTVLGRTQAYVSQQLRVLREANVVIDEKHGLNVYYRIADKRISELLETILGPAKSVHSLPACSCPICTENNAKSDF